MRKEPIMNESHEIEGENLDVLTVAITDNRTGETLYNESVGVILFSAKVEDNGEQSAFSTALIGECSQNTIINALSSTIDGVVDNLKAHFGFEASDFIELMAHLTKRTIAETFTKQEQVQAMLQATLKMAEMRKKDE